MLEPEEVAQRRFLVTSRGYDRDEVRAFLSELAETVAALQREQEDLQRELARARASAAAHGATPPGDPGAEAIGAKTAAVLAAAHEAAEEIERQARQQANRELRVARHQAAATVAEAERQRDQAQVETDRLEARQAYLQRDLRVMERSASRLAERLDALRGPQPEARQGRGERPEALSAGPGRERGSRDSGDDSEPAEEPHPSDDSEPAEEPHPSDDSEPAEELPITGAPAPTPAPPSDDARHDGDPGGRPVRATGEDRGEVGLPAGRPDGAAVDGHDAETTAGARERETLARPVSLFSVLGLFLVGSIAAAALLGLGGPRPQLEVSGPEDGAVLGAPALDDLVFTATSAGDDLAGARLSLDGRDVTAEATVDADGLRYAPADLADGDHVLRLEIGEAASQEASHTWRFAVETTPPELTVLSPGGPVAAAEPIVVAGTATGAQRVEVDGQVAGLDDGRFSHTVARAAPAEVTVVAVDALGNSAETTLEVAAADAAPEAVRGVRMSMWAWASPAARQAVLDLAEEGLISAVSLDVKDETGAVGHGSDVDLARRSGAVRGLYDLDEAVATLEEHDVRVIARVVAFADPHLADWLWQRDRRDAVVQTTDGRPRTSGFGGFTSFVDDEVRDYNVALAVEAAEAGVDDILWGGVHRPDGAVDDLLIEGLEGTPEAAIAGFLGEAAAALEPTGVTHGASVYGIAADRPTEIGQDVPAIAEHVDYLAPIVYPSSWREGEHGIADPTAEPRAIVRAALEVFTDALGDDTTRLVPWLQDAGPDRGDGAEAVRAQIEGAAAAGVEEFLLWSQDARSTRGALE